MSRLTEAIEKYKELSKEKDCLARTFRGFRDYGNPKSTITSEAEENQHLSEEYGQLAEWLEELQSLRDKQEQGLLISVPVKPEDTVYVIVKKNISPQKVIEIRISCNGIEIMTNRRVFHISAIGETVFLTRSEAESELAKMGGK